MNKEQFRKLYAVIFVILALVFGILLCIAEKDFFKSLGSLTWGTRAEIAASIWVCMNIGIDVMVIAVPAIYLILILLSSEKTTPFKAISKSAQAVLAKYIFVIFIWLFVLIIAGADGQAYKDYFFGEGSMMIIPAIIFTASAIALSIATSKGLADNAPARAIATAIGSGLAITGLCVYYGFDKSSDGLVIFGLVVAIVCFAALVVYCFLPQTKE